MIAPVGYFSADVDGLLRKYPTWEPESSMINLGSDVHKPLRQSHSTAIGETWLFRSDSKTRSISACVP